MLGYFLWNQDFSSPCKISEVDSDQTCTQQPTPTSPKDYRFFYALVEIEEHFGARVVVRAEDEKQTLEEALQRIEHDFFPTILFWGKKLRWLQK